MRNDRADIVWAPRVKLHKIRALYLSNARGIYDGDLIDDVGTALFVRCESILEFTAALEGRVKCMRCARSRTTTMIDRVTGKTTEVLRCPICSWQVQWRVYLAEANKTKGQLTAGNARAAFEAFVARYPRCRSAKDKMLAIDRLLHEFHWWIRSAGQDPQASRTACVNLLAGSMTQILDLLDGLAYDENATPELLETRHWWRSQKPIARRREERQEEP
jgi:hypothetical protein